MRKLTVEDKEQEILQAMRSLVESSIDPIVQINCKGIIRLVNPACCKCFQYEESELIGKNINQLMPEPYATKHNTFIANYLKTGIPKVVERGRKGRSLPGRRRDGTTFPMFLTLSESIVNGEKVFTGIMRNLSAEEEERQILAAMIDSCVDPIVVITTQGVIERCNPACTSVFGYTKDELIGGNVTMLMPEPHAANHQIYIDRYLNKNVRKRSGSDISDARIVGKGRELFGKKKDGSTFPVFLTISEFEISGRTSRHGFIGIMRDMSERERAIAAEVEKKKSETLLMNVLPHHICERLMKDGNHELTQIADAYDNVTILFADIVGFTAFASERSPMEVVHYLNKVFRSFDVLVGKYNLEKIKTIGDAYMAVSGLDNDPGNIYTMIKFSLEMLDTVAKLKNGIQEDGKHIAGIRIGLHSGSVVAGVVGTKRRFFDLWGDAVNVASRMESSGVANCVHCTKIIADEAKKHPREFLVIPRGNVDIKGKGQIETYIVSNAENQEEIKMILKEHRASRRRTSHQIHKKLEEEFNFDKPVHEKKSSLPVWRYSTLTCTFLAGSFTALLILKSTKDS